MDVCIITGRAGSKSIPNKNVYPVLDRPLISYPIEAARASKNIERIYVSTDGQQIADVSRSAGCQVIPRPEELSGDTVNHGDVIRHAVTHVEEDLDDLENVVLLLANTVMVDGELIDMCLDELHADPSLDSVMTVWEAADDHPYRALEIREGLVRSWAGKPSGISTERQSYPSIYYYDQGVWAFRKECVEESRGPDPWWWMGERVRPVLRTWITGRDIHSHFDVSMARHYVQNREDFARLEARQVVRDQ